MAKAPSDDLPALVDEALHETPEERAAIDTPSATPSATQAALTLIAANLAMKFGTSLLRGTVERAILRGRFGESAAEWILKEKRVKGSGLASTAAKYATRSRPGALVVGAGLLAKTLFDKGGERRARLAGKKKR